MFEFNKVSFSRIFLNYYTKCKAKTKIVKQTNKVFNDYYILFLVNVRFYITYLLSKVFVLHCIMLIRLILIHFIKLYLMVCILFIL